MLRRLASRCAVSSRLAQVVARRWSGAHPAGVTPTRTEESSTTSTPTLPAQARVVICGGGVIGTSVAYHLAKLGYKDVLLLEQGVLGCGTTWHAAGLVGKMRGTFTETKLSDYGSKLYPKLEEETGVGTGWKPCGSLTLARNNDRLTFLRRNCAKAKAFGITAEIVSPAEAKKLWPLIRTDDLVGALWLPEDGVATSSDVTQALAKGARMNGVRIFERVKVRKVNTVNGAVSSVETDRGTIACEIFVNCGGQWAREIGQLVDPPVIVPLHSAEHFYIVTKPLEGVYPMLPVMRDPDGYTYWREWSGGLIMGGFEPVCKPVFHAGRIPYPFEFQLFPEDWEHFDVLMREALLRVPTLADAEIRQMVNGPESFTPDNQYVLGEAPAVRRYYVAAGFNSSGVASAAGAGKALSEWIAADAPTMDLWAVDIRRFGEHWNNKTFLRQRTLETLGLHYQIGWPRREFESARGIRRSPLYAALDARGASWGQKAAWERPNWFAESGAPAEARKNTYTFGRPNWFERVRQEHRACREAVAVFDQTSFGKLLVTGSDALRLMQRLCANNLDVEIGKVVYTGMLNPRGGYESDVTVTRLAEDTFYLVTSTAQVPRDIHWIKSTMRDENLTHVSVVDITSAYAVISVMGPKSREVLSRLLPGDLDISELSNEKFPFGTARTLDLGRGARVRAIRVTYVGELGWELHVPSEFALALYEELSASAAEAGGRDAGYYAIESLRLEKGYRAWGAELAVDTTPIEAGLAFAVAWDKPGGFIGREALLKQRAEGVYTRLALFALKDPEAMPWGGEAILRDGKVVGFTTSATFGFTLGRGVAMGYVENKGPNGKLKVDASFINTGTWELDLAGKTVPMEASLKPFYDPQSLRIKA